MFNALRTRIRDIVEVLKDPPLGARAACKITPANRDHIVEAIGVENEKYVHMGHYYLLFDNDQHTIVPPKDFFKHYELVGTPSANDELVPVKTIKPLFKY